MVKQIIGLDIGENAVKMAMCGAGHIDCLAVSELPENMVTGGRILSPASMSEFLRTMKRENRISARDCAVILPEQAIFTRELTVPAMTIDQLLLNLPYEFRDFITHEKDKYFYDYAVIRRRDDEDGKPIEFDLTACAVLKETIAVYRDMLRRAGFRLSVAIPQALAFANLLRTRAVEGESCLLDIGHTSTRVLLYHGRQLEMSKVIEHGCSLLDLAIAETMNVDEHVARSYKITDFEGALSLEACKNVYASIALEVMKALNFHSYEHRDNTLDKVYYCGGGALVRPLLDAISEAIPLELEDIRPLLPTLPTDDAAESHHALLCAAAIGATQQ